MDYWYPGSYQPSGHVNISRAREFNHWDEIICFIPITGLEKVAKSVYLVFEEAKASFFEGKTSQLREHPYNLDYRFVLSSVLLHQGNDLGFFGRCISVEIGNNV